MSDSRKKISKNDSIITWNIDGEIVKKTFAERLKEVRSQAQEKTRKGDFVRSSGYSKKMDGSIQASARVETSPLLSWILEVPFPMSDVTRQHPDVIKILEEKDNKIKELNEIIAKKELDQLKKDKSNHKGSKAVTIFRKNFCERNFRDWFKEYYKTNYKPDSMVDDCVVKDAYQASKAWENLPYDLEEEQSDYKEGIHLITQKCPQIGHGLK